MHQRTNTLPQKSFALNAAPKSRQRSRLYRAPWHLVISSNADSEVNHVIQDVRRREAVVSNGNSTHQHQSNQPLTVAADEPSEPKVGDDAQSAIDLAQHPMTTNLGVSSSGFGSWWVLKTKRPIRGFSAVES